MKKKIALIMSEGMRPQVFSNKTIDRLREYGDVVFNYGSCSVDDIAAAIRGADIAVTSWGNISIDKPLLDLAPDLKLVAHAAGSVKPIVSDELFARGIRVVSSAAPLGIGVAETALGFTISASKNFFNLSKHTAAGGWNDNGYDQIRELYDLTIGVVGAGWAGSHYIKLIQNFGVDVLLYDPYISEEKAAALGAKKADLETLLKTSDIVSVHAPSIPATNHMFNKDTLALMKKDAILINTARGTLIDEAALYQFMKDGNLKYACLDVTDPEPPVKDNPLRTLSNVILTPHLAGLANNGKLRIGAHITDEIERFLKGQLLTTEVTQKMLATMA
ncbi:MAG: hypothetical protein A2Y17_06655 [Clostridiales bacterium GWF2_38_85]|nr:MAG: hypothetical protein A2Y17_06655 [Clostridiales bacterium GWF2_38_85]HBL84895.1 hydroxyacid dehydrogenase [Clostridiales bacterium]